MSAVIERDFDPSRLLDVVLGKMQLKNDAALCRMLEIAPPMISKIRRGHAPVGAALLLRLHDVTRMPITDMRELMGDRRTRYRTEQTAWTDAERATRLQGGAA